jgi:hypothetical protein
VNHLPASPRRRRPFRLAALLLFLAAAPLGAQTGGLTKVYPSPASLREVRETSSQERLPPPETAPGPIAEAVPLAPVAGCADGSCGAAGCVPGRLHHCDFCDRGTLCGRLLCGFYEELCCPDPCYEGVWIPAANSAFFVEGTRPVTTTRIRFDYVRNWELPDRSEFFWAKIGGKGPGDPETRVRYCELNLYQEIAAKGFSAFIETPYYSMTPEVNAHAGGFGDLKVGTKALLFDRDLFQIGFMFKTYIPTGNFTRGLGTGHVSLEPSLLATLKLTHDTYLQGQLSEWIPIGGDSEHQGSLLHYHLALNQVLYRPLNDVELIGSFEFNGYSFQDGLFTAPDGTVHLSGGDTYVSIGPSLRLVVCTWLDFGSAASFAIGDHGPEQIYRTEFRVRY